LNQSVSIQSARKTTKTLPAQDCGFGYRTSIFKHQLAGDAVILSVRFRLSLRPVLNIEYKGLKEELQKYPEPGIRAVREAVIAIRRRKLPDPAQVGNAGSFFKNPVYSQGGFYRIESYISRHTIVPAGDGFVKLPAAWLIEKCGWKGYRKGDAGVHPHQPLVLVNYGKATGTEIYELAGAIQTSVYQTFGIKLEPEVRII
jgi:UDP-N-acetylmuramate dehydrogenase